MNVFFWANAIIMYLMVALGHSYGLVLFLKFFYTCSTLTSGARVYYPILYRYWIFAGPQ